MVHITHGWLGEGLSRGRGTPGEGLFRGRGSLGGGAL